MTKAFSNGALYLLPPPHVPAPVPPKRSNGALQMLPLRPVSVAVSAYVGGAARPPISLITPFLRDINPV